MSRQATRTPDGKTKRGTRHRGSGINKRNAAAEERWTAMRAANTALAASLLLSDAEVGIPDEPSTSQVVAATDSTPSSPRGRSAPNSSPSNQLSTAPTNNAAAAAAPAAIEPQDTEADTFLASLSIHTTTNTENTPAAQTPNEDNAGNDAAAETQAGEGSAGIVLGVGKPKRKRAFDFFDDSSNENEKHVDREGGKHA